MPGGSWFFLIFFAVALTILFGGHYFLYRSLVYFFGLGKKSKWVLAAVFTVLPLSFFMSMTFMRQVENSFTRLLSTVSFLWLGVGLALALFVDLAWIIWAVSRFLPRRPRSSSLGWMAIILTLLYSVYGVWNAYHPRLENVTVKIRNLPPQWRGRTAVQITDLHLGTVLGTEFLEGVIAKINSQNPAIVFITGDLFEGEDGDLENFARQLDSIRTGTGVYYVTGNHETYLGVKRAMDAFEQTRIKILNDEIVVIDGLQIIGVSYPERGSSKNIAEVIRGINNYDPDAPSVLLYHSPTDIQEISSAGINLQVSGHTHCGQMFPVNFLTRWIYGKYYRGLHVEGDYTIYTSCGTGAWGPIMRTGNHPEITVIHLE